MEFVALMPFLVSIVAISAWAYVRTRTRETDSAEVSALHDALDDADDEREALRRRIEALEAIVTGEGFELEREAKRAGLLDPDLGAPADEASAPVRRRTRS